MKSHKKQRLSINEHIITIPVASNIFFVQLKVQIFVFYLCENHTLEVKLQRRSQMLKSNTFRLLCTCTGSNAPTNNHDVHYKCNAMSILNRRCKIWWRWLQLNIIKKRIQLPHTFNSIVLKFFINTNICIYIKGSIYKLIVWFLVSFFFLN